MTRYFTLFENKVFLGIIDFVNRILYIRKLEQLVLNPNNKDEPVELVEFINELIKREKTRIIDLGSSLTETEYINMFDTLTKKNRKHKKSL